MIGRFLRSIGPKPVAPPRPGGLPWTDLYPARPAVGMTPRSYRPPWSIAAAAASVLLAPANPSRESVQIVNDGTGTLYISHAPVATTASFAAKLGPGATYVIEQPDVYQGVVSGVWTAPNGFARLTEGVG